MTDQARRKWHKDGVAIGDDVDPGRIASDAVIHPGCRILGDRTSIGPDCVIGAEAPATIENCQLGRSVELKGGFFSGSTFLDGANVGSGAHIRAGTLLEEQSGGAHAVGFKQTILLPFVTAGSLVNFCDVLMAGGTSRSDHSEIGSSYVHFNFTPHQDKATPSLLGDVPRGVFMDQKPIFLGGQGGLVGPVRIAYGTVVAAGGVCRQDVLEANQLHIPAQPRPETRLYELGVYRGIGRIVKNNLVYIGNIMALREWYKGVRRRFMIRDHFDNACYEGALKNLELVLAERLKRMTDLSMKMDYSIRSLEKNGAPETFISEQKNFLVAWPAMLQAISNPEVKQDAVSRDILVGSLCGGDYIASIQTLPSAVRKAGNIWLQSIVDGIEQLWSP